MLWLGPRLQSRVLHEGDAFASPPGDMWPCLETVLVINHNYGCHWQLLGKEMLQTVQRTGQTPTPLELPGLLSKVLRLRSPVLRVEFSSFASWLSYWLAV